MFSLKKWQKNPGTSRFPRARSDILISLILFLTVQNITKYIQFHYDAKLRKDTNPHIWELGTSLTFLLKKKTTYQKWLFIHFLSLIKE